MVRVVSGTWKFLFELVVSFFATLGIMGVVASLVNLDLGTTSPALNAYMTIMGGFIWTLMAILGITEDWFENL